MRAVADGLWTEGDAPALIGGRHRETGRIAFPRPADEAYEPVALQRRGTLWSYTVQRFPPKSPPYAGPEPFEPFALGYVELPGEAIVESRIVGVSFERLRIGLPVELTIVPFGDRSTFAFQPAGGAS